MRFRWLKPKVLIKIQPLEREVCRLRAYEWRADKQFVAMAASVLNQPNLKLMLDCVTNEHPAFNVLTDGTDAQSRVVQQARGEGYTMAIENLLSLAREQALPERIAATFEPERKADYGS